MMIFAPPVVPKVMATIPIEMSKQYVQILGSPAIKAFLDVIAYAEGTFDDDGYRKMYGTKALLQDLAHHPRTKRCRKSNSSILCSSAAGRYQFITDTWNDLVKKLDLPDFGPQSQDIGALHLLHICGALHALEARDIITALRKASAIWASLPGATYGQPTRSMPECMHVFDDRYTYYSKKRE